MKMRMSLIKGFTLIELLAVISIIAILSSLLLPALARGKRKAKEVNEVGAAKQLMIAWQMYADDHNDRVLPGYISQVEAFDNRGRRLGSPIRDRYPWRLAPFLANNFRAIYVNESRKFLDSAERLSHEEFVYRASLYPSLGYNSVFLGGDEQKFNPALASASFGASWLVTRASQVGRPSEQIAFASARSRPGGTRDEPGYYVIHPPYLVSREWETAFSQGNPPERFGYLHPRRNRRAITAMSDGHAEALDERKLQDMRRWCNAATHSDWTLRPQP